MRLLKQQKGFTLVELMLAVAITGIILAVVSSLFLGAFRGWIFNLQHLTGNQSARVARDNISKLGRHAQATQVQIGRFDTQQPPYSMLIFTDVKGQNMAFYQLRDQLWQASWVTATASSVDSITPISITASTPLISNGVRAISFFYPNYKNMRHIVFSISINKDVMVSQPDAFNPVALQVVGDLELRNP
jgi:prepilin-type N-terminal cleavage/methylation domain-containing protein